MYRMPTVRCDDAFGEYINDIYQSTHLDKNQIVRLALFTAPFNAAFVTQLKKHIKPGASLPSSDWEVFEHGYWMDQTYQVKEEEGDANEKNENDSRGRAAGPSASPVVHGTRSGNDEADHRSGRVKPAARREGAISTSGTAIRTSGGGIKFTVK